MIVLSHRALLALAAVADIAIHSRPLPVAAKALAARLELPPRHLETLLQALVRANILKGLRGPRGGYELARERRKITAGAVLRAVLSDAAGPGEPADSKLVAKVIAPMVEKAGAAFLAELDNITIEDICRRADELNLYRDAGAGSDFTI
ncbi:transcriptional regulator, BadM/Rrf2 family [Methylocella silvestris BL2]|uniref:Transcriptional regulator, BadM/Rrf2 family n=1 Tax=Methylocella silvestris (strain DSM 15510 / CIP 108128 / LMG 27833 / NCIMB 13906 / BL2) TaxID=395965 RepID=B8ET40_METSB|nr:Rrf2 family transcriptional regulator [Methylocella silvestris]ACK51178.1 transcriptional regulator, BadM/Rrf2 family [Methylocella silvestris BL2]